MYFPSFSGALFCHESRHTGFLIPVSFIISDSRQGELLGYQTLPIPINTLNHNLCSVSFIGTIPGSHSIDQTLEKGFNYKCLVRRKVNVEENIEDRFLSISRWLTDWYPFLLSQSGLITYPFLRGEEGNPISSWQICQGFSVIVIYMPIKPRTKADRLIFQHFT